MIRLFREDTIKRVSEVLSETGAELLSSIRLGGINERAPRRTTESEGSVEEGIFTG